MEQLANFLPRIYLLTINLSRCRSSFDKVKRFYKSSSIKHKAYCFSGFIMSAANSVSKQNDRTCASYRYKYNTLPGGILYLPDKKNSGFVFPF